MQVDEDGDDDQLPLGRRFKVILSSLEKFEPKIVRYGSPPTETERSMSKVALN
jgi:hypothetical protein